jgi:hypothetical protein
MTIVIEGALTTEKVEKAVEKFEKEARIKNLRKKFWQLNAISASAARKKEEKK